MVIWKLQLGIFAMFWNLFQFPFSHHSLRGGSQLSTDKRFEKVQQQTGKLPKFTKPFCCLSIPTARGCASILKTK
jgi:hypothetical protein